MHRKRLTPHTFDERLSAEKERLEGQLKITGEGQERNLIDRKLRQIETALRIDRWLGSAELRPPE
jgi:hypothetical protein